MGKLVLLLTYFSAISAANSNTFKFFYGMATGYGLSATCLTQLNEVDSEWGVFLDSIPTSKGSGNALYQLHDFSLALTQASTTCNLVQIANLLDEALTSNLLATIIRLVANYADIVIEKNIYSTNVQTGDYAAAGQAIGKIILDLIG